MEPWLSSIVFYIQNVRKKILGGVWTPPYQLNITPFVKTGENKLKIEVVNNWINRIIGDMNLPENERTTWCFVNPYNANSKPQSSGLFGPVTVNNAEY